MLKFRLYFDKDKETQWLNKMANEGWAMNGFFAGFYRFQPCQKGEYIYQIDFGKEFFSIPEDYRSFMSEADIEILQSWGYWVFLRKLTSKGDFELYSDVESQMEHYQKILIMFKLVTVIELICLFIEMMAAIQTKNPLFYGFSFLILAMVIAFLKITFHTGDIIHELKERKTGIEEPRNRNVSVLLSIGLVCNGCALMIQDSVFSFIQMPIQIIAIILMLVGIYKTVKKRPSSD